jgi:hypothetical protein
MRQQHLETGQVDLVLVRNESFAELRQSGDSYEVTSCARGTRGRRRRRGRGREFRQRRWGLKERGEAAKEGVVGDRDGLRDDVRAKLPRADESARDLRRCSRGDPCGLVELLEPMGEAREVGSDGREENGTDPESDAEVESVRRREGGGKVGDAEIVQRGNDRSYAF